MSCYIKKYLRPQNCYQLWEENEVRDGGKKNLNQNLKRNSKYWVCLFCPNIVLWDSQWTHFEIDGIKWNKLFSRVWKLNIFVTAVEILAFFFSASLQFPTPSPILAPKSTTWSFSGKDNWWKSYLYTEVGTSYLILF